MATDMAKAAEFEHWEISSSWAMIFLTLATNMVSWHAGCGTLERAYVELWRFR